MNSGRDHHVEPVLDEPRDRFADAARISGIAVHQDDHVGIHIGEHSPHHVAFALMLLAADHRAGAAGDLDGGIGGVVVVNVDRGFRQRGLEIRHHLGDGGRFIEAGHQHRDPLAAQIAPAATAGIPSALNIGPRRLVLGTFA